MGRRVSAVVIGLTLSVIWIALPYWFNADSGQYVLVEVYFLRIMEAVRCLTVVF